MKTTKTTNATKAKATKGRVILAMSGGVDSSVAAKLLIDEGYTVVGMFMNCGVEKGAGRWPTTISWEEEEEEVRSVCTKLGIELVVKNCGAGYEKKVISEMFRDYSIGLTPNPDILCNNVGKFPLLYTLMQERGFDFIATGHYVQKKMVDGRAELFMGHDEGRDQSYFLVGLPQKYLRRCLFPIGGMTKDEVRVIARKIGFSNWNKKGSRGICYLGTIDMKDFLHSRLKEKEGRLLDYDNRVIGTHPGISFFTIGETITTTKGVVFNAQGTKRYSSTRLYVAQKRRGNVLVVAPKDHALLFTKKVVIKRLVRINRHEVVHNAHFKARIRHLGELHEGTLRLLGNRYVFLFHEPVSSVAPGQYLALYDGERLVGGGEMRLVT